jgi:hypothetical protein
MYPKIIKCFKDSTILISNEGELFYLGKFGKVKSYENQPRKIIEEKGIFINDVDRGDGFLIVITEFGKLYYLSETNGRLFLLPIEDASSF